MIEIMSNKANLPSQIKFLSIAVTLLILLGSCSVSVKKNDNILDATKKVFFRQDKSFSNQEVEDNWWLKFEDAELQRLIRMALKNNQDVKIANLNIITARELNNIDAAALMPSASVGAARHRFASPAFGPQGLRYDLYQSTFDAVWELDFLGKNLDRYQAGKLRFLKEIQLYKASNLRLISEICQNYVRLRTLQKEGKNLQKIVNIRKKLLEIAQKKDVVGNALKSEAHQATINYSEALNQLNDIKSNEKILGHKLAILVGVIPEKIGHLISDNSTSILDYYTQQIPLGLPSDLLKRRADIIAAEYEVDAAGYDKRAQFKEFFPSFNLSAKIGGGAKNLGDTIGNGTNVKDISGAISLPIFSANKLIAEYKISKTHIKTALLNYEKTIIAAVEECESQLIRYSNAIYSKTNSYKALDASRKILHIDWKKRELGIIAEEKLLESEIANIVNENNFVERQSESLVNLVALYKALGGGFESQEIQFKDDNISWIKSEKNGRRGEASNLNKKRRTQ